MRLVIIGYSLNEVDILDILKSVEDLFDIGI